MTRAAWALCASIPLLAFAPGMLAATGAITREAYMDGGAFTCFRAGPNAGDLQIEILTGSKTLRRLSRLHFSVAPLRYCYVATEPSQLSAVITGNIGASANLSFDVPHEPGERDLREWKAQQALIDARALANNKESGIAEVKKALKGAAVLWEQLSDPYQEAVTHRLLADYFLNRADAESAEAEYRMAAVLFESGGWKFEDAIVLQNLASAETQLDHDSDAMGFRRHALALYRELGDHTGEAYALLGSAETLWRVGRLQEALDEYVKALHASRAIRNRALEAEALNGLGLVDVELGRYSFAAKNYAAARGIWRATGNEGGELRTLNNEGLLREEEGHLLEARAALEQSLSLAEKMGDVRSRAYILQNIGDTWLQGSMAARAAEFYRQSIALKASLHDVRAEAESHRKLGLALLAVRSPMDARTEIEKALSMESDVGDASGTAQSYAALSRVDSAAGAISAAEENISKAIEIIESKRLTLNGRGLRTSFFARERDFYDEAIELALKPGGAGPAAAFEWSERSRARALLDAASGAKHPSAFSTLADVQTRLLEPGDVLVEYSLAPHHALGFVVTDKAIRAVSVRVPVAQSSLSRVAELVWTPLGLPAGAKRVIIAAEGDLSRIPFAALPVRAGAVVLDGSDVVVAPSASFLLARKTEPVATKPSSIEVLADPVFSASDPRISVHRNAVFNPNDLVRLRFTLEEARSVETFAPSSTRLFTGSDASAANFLKIASEPGTVLHIATHALGDRLVFSRFSPDGTAIDSDVTADQIYSLKLKKDLVVLAGCRTARGPSIRGEGTQSLSRAFLYAGAHGVVATLWDVDDRTSYDVMRTFYQFLLRDGLAPDLALRRAQMQFRSANLTNIDWAAFTYSGDWRTPACQDKARSCH